MSDEAYAELWERQRALGLNLKRFFHVYSSLPLDIIWLLQDIDLQSSTAGSNVNARGQRNQ
jgi:hypothetical protein